LLRALSLSAVGTAHAAESRAAVSGVETSRAPVLHAVPNEPDLHVLKRPAHIDVTNGDRDGL
jgi:hypothetical protein